MTPSRFLLAFILGAFSTSTALGHEFWIDPAEFSIDPGEELVADIRVGENFEGAGYSYLPRNFRLFEIAQGDARTAVEGRMGDRPALAQVVSQEGLAVVLHVTTDSSLTYKEFVKFEDFVRHKDELWTLQAHTARGLPDAGFGEAYSRYAKSLVAVGNGAGSDRAYGLEVELVALTNPYTDDLTGGFTVQSLYQGQPRTNSQVEVFARAPGGAVMVSTVRTDAKGIAQVPVLPGHVYMLDAVVLREPRPELAETSVVWESLWANLTFAVPPVN